jgi:hypothetical protein
LFDAVHRINEPGYIPTPQDLLRVRIRSSGVEQAEYVYKETKFKYAVASVVTCFSHLR